MTVSIVHAVAGCQLENMQPRPAQRHGDVVEGDDIQFGCVLMGSAVDGPEIVSMGSRIRDDGASVSSRPTE